MQMNKIKIIIFYMDSVRLDLECRRRKLGNPMLEANIIGSWGLKLGKFDSTSNTLIDIGAKIGRLMEATKTAISKDSESGTKLVKMKKIKLV